ncbi:MAG: hypothetical protein WA691_05880 [Thermoplasmata archaeon]
MDEHEFDTIIRRAERPDERVAWFGALLTEASGVSLVIVGGSAIEIYTAGAYVSSDIDIVGSKTRIAPVLRRWGFQQESGRSSRAYWVKSSLGLVDLVGTRLKSELPIQTIRTPYGSVNLGPVEELITRRLMRAGRERSPELFQEAVLLADRYKSALDWDYIEGHAKYERVLPLYEQLRRQVQ